MGAQSLDTKAAEPKETMLSWMPFEVGWYRDPREVIVFNEYFCFLAYAVFEKCPEPWICPTWYIDCCRCDKIVPTTASDIYKVKSCIERHTMT